MAVAINTWAVLESTLGRLLTDFLDADIHIGAAMYTALTSSAAQFDALDAAANTALSGEALEMFQATMIVVRSAGKDRNKIVHGTWGVSPQVPGALIWRDSNKGLNKEAKFKISWERARHNVFRNGKIDDTEMKAIYAERDDRSEFFVWRDTDFNRLISLTHSAMLGPYLISTAKSLAKSTHPRVRAALQRTLDNEPPLREALDRIRSRRKTSPSEPTQ